MTEAERRATMQREKGRGLVRAIHLSELQAAGAARNLALQEIEQQLDRIARALPDALAAGMSLSEVARVTGVSRPTLYELRGRYGDGERDLTLAVFQAIANTGRISNYDIANRIGRPTKEIDEVLKDFYDQGVVLEDFNEDRDEPAMEYWLTDKGFAVLEAYTFDDDGRPRES